MKVPNVVNGVAEALVYGFLGIGGLGIFMMVGVAIFDPSDALNHPFLCVFYLSVGLFGLPIFGCWLHRLRRGASDVPRQ